MALATWITVLAHWSVLLGSNGRVGRIGANVAFGLRNDGGRPGGRPIWRAAVENQLLLADELHPGARRAKNRPCGL
jgi:hypothetical protein